MPKWFEVDMYNSKNQSYYGEQMQKDLANYFKSSPPLDEPEPKSTRVFSEDFETWSTSYNNWDITGNGTYSIIDEDGNKKLKLTNKIFFLWNGNDNLVNVEISADIRVGNTAYNNAALMLRVNADITTYYICYIYYKSPTSRTYYVNRYVNGINKNLVTVVIENRDCTKYIKTRFRIDGTQLLVEDYIDSEWQFVCSTGDTSIPDGGYVGLMNFDRTNYFDNVEIKKKEE